MKVQRLIEKYGEKFKLISKDYPYERALSELWYDIKQLDEPEKVKVPQFVADWIEEARKTCKDVADFFDFNFTNEEVGKWFMQERPFDLVARAWLDGYEVEEEKRYLVKFKATKHYLVKDGNGKIFFSLAFEGRFTKKELEEAGFGWVFDCPGIEIEEVE